jgi:predicted small integral membrane protein
MSLVSGLYYLLVAFDNVSNPSANWKFVRAVLSLDGVPSSSGFGWRAMHSPTLQGAAYAVIIVGECIAGGLLCAGAFRGWAARRSGRQWCGVQWMTFYGAMSGLTIFYLAFIVIGGNWFVMYLNDEWNGLGVAFQNAVLTSMTVVIALLAALVSRDAEVV